MLLAIQFGNEYRGTHHITKLNIFTDCQAVITSVTSSRLHRSTSGDHRPVHCKKIVTRIGCLMSWQMDMPRKPQLKPWNLVLALHLYPL